MALSSGRADIDREGLVQAAAGDQEPGGPLGQGDQEKGDQEEGPKEKMNPRAFPTGRAVYGVEEPEVIDMSLDGPDAPEEVGTNAKSMDPTRTTSTGRRRLRSCWIRPRPTR